jgi:hypothetical protein
MTLATQLQLSIVILGSGIVVGCIRRRWPRDVRIRHAHLEHYGISISAITEG